MRAKQWIEVMNSRNPLLAQARLSRSACRRVSRRGEQGHRRGPVSEPFHRKSTPRLRSDAGARALLSAAILRCRALLGAATPRSERVVLRPSSYSAPFCNQRWECFQLMAGRGHDGLKRSLGEASCGPRSICVSLIEVVGGMVDSVDSVQRLYAGAERVGACREIKRILRSKQQL